MSDGFSTVLTYERLVKSPNNVYNARAKFMPRSVLAPRFSRSASDNNGRACARPLFVYTRPLGEIEKPQREDVERVKIGAHKKF
jgi:hypothetical protein